MKKQFLLYATFVAVVIASCAREALVEVDGDDKNTYTITTIEASIADSDNGATKTVRKSDGKIYWNPSDEINVFFGTDKGKFTSSNTEDAAKASFNGSITISSVIGMNEGEDDDNCVWGLYPYNENATFDGTYVHTSLTNVQTGKAGSFADDLYITLAKSNSFKLSFYNTLAGIKFSIQKEGVRQITFSGNNDEILTGDMKLKFGDDERPVVSEITNGETSIILTPENGTFTVGEYYYIVFAPTTFSKGFSLTFVTATEKGEYTYNKSISFPRNMFGTLANADKDVSYNSIFEYVDLGLSVNWATMNVGAESPEDFGDYFAWGAVEPWYEDGYAQSNNPVWKSGKSEGYTWTNCPYQTYVGSSIDDGLFSKYVDRSSFGTVDNIPILEFGDDAARANWGDTWRMPTVEEWFELRNSSNCTWIRTMSGYKVMSKSNGNSIFLPFAGSRSEDGLYGVYSYGRYWTSSIYSFHPYYAEGMELSTDHYYAVTHNRCSGLSVRPVCPSSRYVCVNGISLNKSSATLVFGRISQLSATISPSNASNKSVIWSSSNPSIVEVDITGAVTPKNIGSATISVTTVDGGYTDQCDITVVPQYVDLGLSVKWAIMNVGASSLEEYGDYFAWGETENKGSYNWSNYKYCKGSNKTMTKYCNKSDYGYNGYTDGNTVLDPEDDAAHVKWGRDWRMPTDDEWLELRNEENCTWTWAEMNGVNGYKVTSKKSGYEGNYIFLPAAGCFLGTSLRCIGSDGYYWSSSLDQNYDNGADRLNFGINYFGWCNEYRYSGFSVRPVCP